MKNKDDQQYHVELMKGYSRYINRQELLRKISFMYRKGYDWGSAVGFDKGYKDCKEKMCGECKNNEQDYQHGFRDGYDQAKVDIENLKAKIDAYDKHIDMLKGVIDSRR